MTDVYVAAGSNVDPVHHLQLALSQLAKLYPAMTVSPAYRNPAVGFAGDDFVNLVVGFVTALRPAQVREQLQAIEAACGRTPETPKWAPRTMDLDILLFGDLISDEPRLVLPRPDLMRRSYMLKPMADIGPDVVHPVSGRTMRELWAAFDGGGHEMQQVRMG